MRGTDLYSSRAIFWGGLFFRCGAAVGLDSCYQPLCCWWLSWPIQNNAKILKNHWNPGKWVLIWEYSVRAIQWVPTWQGLDGFQKSLRICALDESSLSIVRVNSFIASWVGRSIQGRLSWLQYRREAMTFFLTILNWGTKTLEEFLFLESAKSDLCVPELSCAHSVSGFRVGLDSLYKQKDIWVP